MVEIKLKCLGDVDLPDDSSTVEMLVNRITLTEKEQMLSEDHAAQLFRI